MLLAKDVVVFAGAGASSSAPAGLPTFGALRNAILEQLGLAAYVSGVLPSEPAMVEVAAGLAPEPFMFALERSGISVESWLAAVLGGGNPNAVHVAIAQLASAGSRVWTVNFDSLIESAAVEQLRVESWPDDPSDREALRKPHGTLGGNLIVTSEQVLHGLSDAWRQQLRQDVRGRTVVFVGYRGKDLDFLPIWDDVLITAERILWFDYDDHNEQMRKRATLPRVSAAGLLVFPSGDPSVGAGLMNPSSEFVAWCQGQGLVNIPAALVDELLAETSAIAYPPLPGSRLRAKAHLQEILGDIRGARSTYLKRLFMGPQRPSAAREVLTLTLNHGSVARPLRLAQLLPPVGRLSAARTVAQRKRLTDLSKIGNHQAILRATQHLSADSLSTLLILRSASLRVAGSITEAVTIGEEATMRALEERHSVRLAHAAFQWALALLWSERVDEAKQCLEERLAPYAEIAASRWVAWTNFVRAGVLVREGEPGQAIKELALGEERFRAEALVDGVISIETARLTVLRQTGQDDEFEEQRDRVLARMSSRAPRGMYYARGHLFSYEAVDLELAEFQRMHQRAAAAATETYRRLASSSYPLHVAFGHLGLALIEPAPRQAAQEAKAALGLASAIGAGLAAGRAQEFLDDPAGSRGELFFC